MSVVCRLFVQSDFFLCDLLAGNSGDRSAVSLAYRARRKDSRSRTTSAPIEFIHYGIKPNVCREKVRRHGKRIYKSASDAALHDAGA